MQFKCWEAEQATTAPLHQAHCLAWAMYLVVVAALGAGTFPSHSGSACPEGMRHLPKWWHSPLRPLPDCAVRAELRRVLQAQCRWAVLVESQGPQTSPAARMLGIMRSHERYPHADRYEKWDFRAACATPRRMPVPVAGTRCPRIGRRWPCRKACALGAAAPRQGPHSIGARKRARCP